jgi:hypothetical protein
MVVRTPVTERARHLRDNLVCMADPDRQRNSAHVYYSRVGAGNARASTPASRVRKRG